MSYNYQTERPFVFTEKGQETFLRVRDRVKYLLKEAGAFNLEHATSGICGDSWSNVACVDRLVELGEIEEIPIPGGSWGQYRVFFSGKRHNR